MWQVLERYHEGQPRARVFAHALWGLGTPAEWAEWEPWVQGSLSPELYAEMAPLFVRDTQTTAKDSQAEAADTAKPAAPEAPAEEVS